MPDGLQDLARMPDFQDLPLPEKEKVLRAKFPDFGTLPPAERQKVLEHVGYPTPVESAAQTRGPSDLEIFRNLFGSKVEQAKAAAEVPSRALGEASQSLRAEAGREQQAHLAATARGREVGSAALPAAVLGAGADITALGAAATSPENVAALGAGLLVPEIGTPAFAALSARQVHGAMGQMEREGATPEAIQNYLLAWAGLAGSAAGVRETFREGGILHAPDALRHPVETYVGGPRAMGVEEITRGLTPGRGGLRDVRGYVQPIADDLAEIQRRTPLEGTGGIVKADRRLRNFGASVGRYLQSDIMPQMAQQVRRWQGIPVSLQSLKDAMRGTISQVDRELAAGAVRKIGKLTASKALEPSAMPDVETLGQLWERRKTINAYLQDLQAKTASGQVKAEQTKAIVDALKAQDRAIGQVMERELTSRGEQGFDALERRYMGLSKMKEMAEAQMDDAEAYRMLGAMRLHAGTAFRPWETIKVSPSSGRLVERGMERLVRSGAKPPAAKPDFDLLPAPPSRRLPAEAGPRGRVVPGVYGPEGRTVTKPPAIQLGPGEPTMRYGGTPEKPTLEIWNPATGKWEFHSYVAPARSLPPPPGYEGPSQ